jgi:uncharacterized protein (DUF433 family)
MNDQQTFDAIGQGVQRPDPERTMRVLQIERERSSYHGRSSEHFAPRALANQGLSVEARVLLIGQLANSLGTRAPSLGIEKTPGVTGGRARLVRTRIPVWTIESYIREGLTAEEIVRAFPTISVQDVRSAQLYAATHRGEIEQDILDNRAEP